MRPLGPAELSTLRGECQAFALYLIGRRPEEALIRRYEEGWRHIRALGAEDSPSMRAVRRWPVLLPFLDAACALRRKEDPLRRKLLLVAALLETTPRYADDFLPRHRPLPSLLMELGWSGLRGTLKACVGLVILPILERRAR